MIQTVIDADRIIAVLVGIVVALQVGLLTFQTCQRKPRPVQFGAILTTLLGIFAADVSIVFTEIGRLGHVLTWRLPTNNVALFLLLYGLGRFLHRRPRKLEGAAQVVGPYPPPSQIARKNSLLVVCAVVALLAVSVLGGAVMVTRANGRAAVAKTRADVAQHRADDVQHQIDKAIAANDIQFCDQEALIAGLPTRYPPPTSALGRALTSTLLHVQASGADLLNRFHCPKR